MKTEIEVKFCQVDVDDIRARLEAAGATREEPMRPMRRTVFYPVDRNPDAYLRVRDEGDKVTMTFKRFDSKSLYGAKEIETEVATYETTVELLQAAGLQQKSVQETRRETWQLANTEIVIDEWPWLPPFIEIEGEDEASVRQTATAIGCDWQLAVFGGATEAYRQYYTAMPADFIIDTISEIRFTAPSPQELKR